MKVKKNYLIITVLILMLMVSVSIFFNNNSRTVMYLNNSDALRKGTNNEYIAFTCNVDWGTEYVQPILDILKENNIKITFFISGRWAKNNPQILKAIYNDGHEIGNHGYGHRMHSKISYEENYKEIKDTHEIIKDIIQIDINYFAPPAGDYNEQTLEVANELGYTTILWNIDTIDWRNDATSEKIINRVLTKPLEASIVLMHPKQVTIKALPNLIKEIHKKNINIGTVSNVLHE